MIKLLIVFFTEKSV